MIWINLSLEIPQYCRGVSHTPATFRHIMEGIKPLLNHFNSIIQQQKNGLLILRFRNDPILQKKQKIDSSFYSESRSGISNSERSVKNLYVSPSLDPVILNRRLRNCTPIPSLLG